MSAAGVNPLNMCAIALAWQLNRAAFSAKELHDERKGGEVLGKPKLLAFRKWASAVRLWQAREVRPPEFTSDPSTFTICRYTLRSNGICHAHAKLVAAHAQSRHSGPPQAAAMTTRSQRTCERSFIVTTALSLRSAYRVKWQRNIGPKDGYDGLLKKTRDTSFFLKREWQG